MKGDQTTIARTDNIPHKEGGIIKGQNKRRHTERLVLRASLHKGSS